jgi:hypothetical protein
MKLTNGKILIFTGFMHSLFAILPIAYGKQFNSFSKSFFFKISDGLSEFPLLNGQMNHETFSAFWFFYFGLIIIPLGFLVNSIEKQNLQLPQSFIWSYLIITSIGVYMIPFSGMTIFMLPHAVFMLIRSRKTPNK